MTVISYVRWSTLEQGNSDRSSEYRQLANIARYASRHDLTIGRTLTDSGRSAFTGANLSVGELGKLTRSLLAHTIDPASTTIIVEELDRLSRRPPTDMMGWMMPLLSSGVTFIVANTNQVITHQSINTDFGKFMMMMTAAFSAYEFSRKQQERGNLSWDMNRNAAVTGQNLRRHRARKWLGWDAATKTYIAIPERVQIIREMFAMRINGHGKSAIATTLNERAKTDPRCRVWVTTQKKQPKLWTPSAVARIVQDIAVMGLLQYNRKARGADKANPVGEPIKIYPEIIDSVTFALANNTRLENQLKMKGKGTAIANLLGSGTARCAKCGAAMTTMGSSAIKVRKDGSKMQHYFLYCSTAKATKGRDCDHQRGWSYAKIEQPLLDSLLTLAIDDQHFVADTEATAKLEGDVVRCRAAVDLDTKSAQRMLAMIDAEPDDDLLASQYQAVRARLKQAKADLKEAETIASAARGQVTPAEHIVRVNEVREQMSSDDPHERYKARLLVKSALQAIIERIDFYPDRENVSVRLIEGLGLTLIRPGVQRKPSTYVHFPFIKGDREYVGASPEGRALIERFRAQAA